MTRRKKPSRVVVTRIGDLVRRRDKPRTRGEILGWDLRAPHTPVYYVQERRSK
jgi:hypothetical protein